MVGLSGIVGERVDAGVETVPPTVDDERTSTYRGAGIAVRSAFHEGMAVDQPVEAADGTLVWVWGEVYTVVGQHGGRRKVDPRETARVCAEGYDAHGLDFVSRLDGEFIGCLYNPAAATASFFVDRLGARPLYYTTDGDGLAFSTNVQTVPEVPGFEPAFNVPYLAEYLYSRRAFGTKTPIEGVERLAPATILTYDVESDDVERHRYWEPEYRPVDKPLSYFVRKLAERLERAVADRMPDPDGEYGLLLSGGSDSRTVLAAAESPPRSYHMGDGWNREARTAKRAADAAGAEFEMLERGPDYHATLLERAAPIMEFIGPFHTGHALGFAERLHDGVDVLLTGLYSDALFGDWSIPQPTVYSPSRFDVEFSLPVARLPTTIGGYVAAQAAAQPTRRPSFLRAEPFEDILGANLREHDRNGRIDHHGVTYASVEQLSISEFYHPVTNGIGFDLYSSLQILPIRNPFLDRRLIDLHLSIPLKYRLRYDLVHRAMEALDPSLAAIPHASTRMPVHHPRVAHVAGSLGNSLLSKFDRSPASYRTQGPWQDRNEVVRHQDFVERTLAANEDLIRELPFLDWEAVRETHRSHLVGETDDAEELYRLITVLEMPLTRRIADR